MKLCFSDYCPINFVNSFLNQNQSDWIEMFVTFRYPVKASFKLTKQKTHELWIAFGWCVLLLTSTKLLVQNATTFEVASLMFQSETNWGFGLNPCEICLSNVRTYTLSYLFSNKIWNLMLTKKHWFITRIKMDKHWKFIVEH
jgi:hypothetical protein